MTADRTGTRPGATMRGDDAQAHAPGVAVALCDRRHFAYTKWQREGAPAYGWKNDHFLPPGIESAMFSGSNQVSFSNDPVRGFVC
jgi:hypothetical protein